MSITQVPYNTELKYREVYFSDKEKQPLGVVLQEIREKGDSAMGKALKVTMNTNAEKFKVFEESFNTIENEVKKPLSLIASCLKKEKENRSFFATFGRQLFTNPEGEKITPILASIDQIWGKFCAFYKHMNCVLNALQETTTIINPWSSQCENMQIGSEESGENRTNLLMSSSAITCQPPAEESKVVGKKGTTHAGKAVANAHEEGPVVQTQNSTASSTPPTGTASSNRFENMQKGSSAEASEDLRNLFLSISPMQYVPSAEEPNIFERKEAAHDAFFDEFENTH